MEAARPPKRLFPVTRQNGVTIQKTTTSTQNLSVYGGKKELILWQSHTYNFPNVCYFSMMANYKVIKFHDYDISSWDILQMACPFM
jgi:hypothetical protein